MEFMQACMGLTWKWQIRSSTLRKKTNLIKLIAILKKIWVPAYSNLGLAELCPLCEIDEDEYLRLSL